MADKTVSFFKGQIPARATGQIHCTFHREEMYQLFCITCQELACIQCVSTIHRRHEIDNLKDLTPQKKSAIQNFIDTSENVQRDEFKRSLATVDKKLKENEDNFERLSVATEMQGNKLKQAIDDLTKKKILLLQQLKEENAKQLTDSKIDICGNKQKYADLLKQCKDTVQEGSDIQVHDVETEVKTYFVQPSVPALQVVTFKPNSDPLLSLEHAFGSVKIGDKKIDDITQGYFGSQSRKIFDSVTRATNTEMAEQILRRPLSARPKQRTPKKNPIMPISPQDQYTEKYYQPTKVLADFVPSDPLLELEIIGEEAWTCCGGCLECITLINKKGENKRQVHFKHFVMGISVSPTTRNVWVQIYNGQIVEVTTKDTIQRFTTDANILNAICVTRDEHILLGKSGQLAKLTTNGKTVLKTAEQKRGHSLCASPCRMSECRISGNIAMVDGDHVLVLDSKLQQVFTYKRGMSTHDQRLSADRLHPVDVTYDYTGRLVVCHSDIIYILNNDGKFLKQLFYDEQFKNLQCICIDEKGTLWLGAEIHKVKLLQYFL
ncbi:uncharacterized protein LOC117332624 [Pecten maximus]|uniref:uncharacterized protein LOC117332624 n=1 Tax=Pecten maximus TaxID=6579 RepID=UPI00145875B1|nr:uncharacterized protein LOC117332624 [Pecten maximus]